MNFRILMGLALSAGLAANAQQVNLRGKISDATGKAVSGAIVSLNTAGHSDTTGADGMYTLNFMITALRPNAGSQSEAITLDKGGVLELAVAQAAPIKIEIFDVRGNLLDRQALDKASAGSYRLNLAGRVQSGNLLIIKASIGSLTKSFRFIQTATGAGLANASLQSINTDIASLAKTAATVDVLKVTAPGYTAKSVDIESYDATVNVTLEAAGGGGTDRWGGLKNPAKKSAGCGKANTVTTGAKKITSDGKSRDYSIDIPSGYDMNKPYRLFYCSHWIGSSDDAVVNGQLPLNGGAANWGYYGLKRQATTANDPAIFIAPQSVGSTWQENDHLLFEDLVKYAKETFCIDESRVFATGFSFGGMITYSLSTNHQTTLRAAVGIAPANYNIYLPNPIPRDPIAWMSTTGTSDGTCPWGDGVSRGAQAIAKQRAQDNGCTVPATIPKNSTAKSHICYDFEGCKPGYPVKACTFDGGHIAAAADGTTGDDGLKTWIPTESWKFFTQF